MFLSPGANPSAERRIVHDFLDWRGQLTSVQHLGAYRRGAGAPPVLVIAAEVAESVRKRSGIVGRVVQFGETAYSIVGLMRDGFAFPVNDRF